MLLKRCPRCSSTDVKKIKFNWWGGIVGALVADEYNCNKCSFKFKGSIANTNPIVNVPLTPSAPKLVIPDTCPHCKSPNSKKIRLCEWCGNQII